MARVKPGECYDKNRRPIYPGDLIKSYHFTDRRHGRRHYLYHVAVWNADQQTMELVPTSHLEPSTVSGGGRCWLSQHYVAEAEIISGHGPGDFLDFTDRPKIETPPPSR